MTTKTILRFAAFCALGAFGCSAASQLSFLPGSGSTRKGSAPASAAPGLPVAGASVTEVAATVTDEDADAPPSDDDIVKPAPGIETVVAEAPTWCEGANRQDRPSGVNESNYVPQNLHSYVFREGIDRFGYVPDRAASIVAWSACLRPADKNRQRWIASFRQAMLNTNGMTVAENREHMKLLVMSEKAQDKLFNEACAKLDEQPTKTNDARTHRSVMISALGCPSAKREDGGVIETIQHLGTLPEIKSQIALAVFVHQCLVGDGADLYGEESALMHTGNLASYAFCQRDVQQLDRNKLHKEVDALKLTAPERVEVFRTFAAVARHTSWMTSAYKQQATKQPWIQALLFDAPRAGFDAWMKLYKANQAKVDMARAWETKFRLRSGSQAELKASFAGCVAPLRKALADYVKAKAPKTASAMRDVLADGVGHPLVVATAACEALQGERGLAIALQDLVLKSSLGIQGPRHQAYEQTVRKLAELAQDQPKFPLQVGSFHPDATTMGGSGWATSIVKSFAGGSGPMAGWIADDQPSNRGKTPDGIVKSVVPKNGGVVVTFKTEKWNEPLVSCTSTNKVDRIDFIGGNAKVVYQQNCKPAGSEPRSFTLAPIWVPSAFASGLRPGLVARVFAVDAQDAAPGLVVEAYADPQRTRLAYSLVTGL